MPHGERGAAAVPSRDVLEHDTAFCRIRVSAMPARQRVLHRLSVSRAVRSWVLLCLIWRVGMFSVRRRYIPILDERNQLSALPARIVLSGWCERAAPLRKR